MDYQKFFATFLNEAASAASEIALRHFRGPLPVDEKEDRSPVTQADREIEENFRAMIVKTFPDHGIVGEEYGMDKPDAEFVWVIDPIDGTRAFMTGKPTFGTIIGLMHKGRPAIGLIEQAYTKERWFGVADTMATHNGRPIKVAPPRALGAARLFIGAPNMFEGTNIDKYLALYQAARWPQCESDCYAYGLLAMGCADIVVHRSLKLYDVAGVVPIVTGAGGFASTWKGNPIDMQFDGTFVTASCRELAMEALQIIL